MDSYISLEEQYKRFKTLEASTEKTFDIESLLQEIEPLLHTYFIVEVTNNGNELLLKFLNGQKFVLTAKIATE